MELCHPKEKQTPPFTTQSSIASSQKKKNFQELKDVLLQSDQCKQISSTANSFKAKGIICSILEPPKDT